MQMMQKFFNFPIKWHQEGLFASQKRSSRHETSAEETGGLTVTHGVDGKIDITGGHLFGGNC